MAITQKKIIGFSLGICLLLFAGLISMYFIKKDSAGGRLFMWKISVMAVCRKPLTGYGTNSFPAVYGVMQEEYFSTGNYSELEERVAGSPEYAFNEYLQTAVECGIPVLFLLLTTVGFCFYIGMKKHCIGICGGILSLMVFAFSSYPFRIPVFVVTFIFLLTACLIRENRLWLGVFALLIGISGFYLKKTDDYNECCRWKTSRMFYQAAIYDSTIEEYAVLYPALSNNPVFLFEYGHAYHKLGNFKRSNEILMKAISLSNDPMILNIIGKNYQSLREYSKAEYYFHRSVNRLPGRIYPYYLLVKLYAEPEFYDQEKLEKMAEIVLTKEPKVESTAVREMRDEVKKILTSVN